MVAQIPVGMARLAHTNVMVVKTFIGFSFKFNVV